MYFWQLELNSPICIFDAGLLFPMKMNTVLKCLQSVVGEWFPLGLELGLPSSTLSTIEHNNPKSVEICKRQMVQRWITSPQLNPNWCSFVKALHEVGQHVVATEITETCRKLFGNVSMSVAKVMHDEFQRNIWLVCILVLLLYDSVYRCDPPREAPRSTDFRQDCR